MSLMAGRRRLDLAVRSKLRPMIVLFVLFVLAMEPTQATTVAELKAAILSTTQRTLIVNTNIALDSNLPAFVNTDLTIRGVCAGGQLCKIDGMNRYSAFLNPRQLTITDIEITRTTTDIPNAAPVIYGASAADVSLTNCRITRNSNPNDSGAISVHDGSRVKVVRSRFENNRAQSGGAIWIGWFSSLQLQDVSFVRNTAKRSAGAIYCGESVVNCTRCIFESNSAEERGGAIVFYDEDGTEAHFYSSRFSNNKVTKKNGIGGAVLMAHITGNVDFCRNTFTGNTVLNSRNKKVTQHVYIDEETDNHVYFCPNRPSTGIVQFYPWQVVESCSRCPSN